MKTPSFIGQLSDKKKILASSPISKTGMLCPECFSEISTAEVQGKFLIFFCDCYSRIFEPDSPRAASLTAQAWHQFIRASQGYKIASALNEQDCDISAAPIVNVSAAPNYEVWCPACARDRKIAAKGVWVSEQGHLVCVYGVCSGCMQRVSNLSPEEQEREIDLVTARLGERYPFLRKEIL
jgi:hypothetical protein